MITEHLVELPILVREYPMPLYVKSIGHFIVEWHQMLQDITEEKKAKVVEDIIDREYC